MDLDALRKAVIDSKVDDWNLADAGGPTYLDAFSDVQSWEGGQTVHWLDHQFHHTRAVFKPAIEIGMAWGLPRDPDDSAFWEEWVERFPDKKASAAWLDLLYNGQPVDRRLYVIVDGGRCKIPLPEEIFQKNIQSRETRRYITYGDYRLFALVNDMASGVDYERYLDQTGLDVARTP